MQRTFSTCVSADNTFNNYALLLIFVEMVFEFSKRSNIKSYPELLRELVIREVLCRRVLTVVIMFYVTIKAKCDDCLSSLSQREIIFGLLLAHYICNAS